MCAATWGLSVLARPRAFASAILSGGERNRLLLARLFARPATVLVCWTSPPTTWTSKPSTCWKNCCRTTPGTVFLVSHDRTFLDNVVTSTIAYEGDGVWREFEGGVEDWLQQSQRSQALRDQRNTPPAATAAPAPEGRAATLRPKTNKPPPQEEAELQGAARAGATARPHRRAGGRAAVHPARAGRWHALHPRPAAQMTGPASPAKA